MPHVIFILASNIALFPLSPYIPSLSLLQGTSEGPILVLSVPPKGADPEVVFTRQLQGHSVAVCDLATNDQGQLASCDESGMIIVWADPASSAESRVVINEPG